MQYLLQTFCIGLSSPKIHPSSLLSAKSTRYLPILISFCDCTQSYSNNTERIIITYESSVIMCNRSSSLLLSIIYKHLQQSGATATRCRIVFINQRRWGLDHVFFFYKTIYWTSYNLRLQTKLLHDGESFNFADSIYI